MGCWGELLSTIPPLTAPAWSTFATGKNPGKMGCSTLCKPTIRATQPMVNR
ncbi:MAG: alkaline phosphatase family protein [Anaerolineales bacterium]|nr:alkaline phosphatase family protein [Anaerolineales bacterium]